MNKSSVVLGFPARTWYQAEVLSEEDEDFIPGRKHRFPSLITQTQASHRRHLLPIYELSVNDPRSAPRDAFSSQASAALKFKTSAQGSIDSMPLLLKITSGRERFECITNKTDQLDRNTLSATGRSCTATARVKQNVYVNGRCITD